MALPIDVQSKWAVTAVLLATLAVGLATLATGCGEDDPSEPDIADQPELNGSGNPSVSGQRSSIRFRSVTDSSGVAFAYNNGSNAGHFAILESLGGGAAVSDFDVDGHPDLLFCGGGTYEPDGRSTGLPGALYRGLGQLQFNDITGVAHFETSRHYSHAVCCADFNEDGFPDVLITGYGGLTLLSNQGDGTFLDVTHESELNDPSWSSSAAWADFDGDGSLDVYVAHYVDWSPENNRLCYAGKEREICPPREFSGLTDSLFLSTGDGRFRSAGQEMGLVEGGKGLGVIAADMDLDGDVDVYVANDTVQNFHYVFDQAAGKLVESAILTGTGTGAHGSYEGSMGCDLGDFDRDGLPDIWVANYEGEAFSLHRNTGNSVFLPAGRRAGVDSIPGLYVGWGTLFADFDLDLDEDLFVTNGHVILYPTDSTRLQKPLLLANDSGRKLHNVAPGAGHYMADAHEGRGVAAGDLDLDGDVDLVVSHLNSPAAVLENVTETSSHWLMIKLVGVVSTRNPIGSRIEIETTDGILTRHVKGGTSYASTSEAWLHVGLGPHETVQTVTVTWRSGMVTQSGPLDADRRYVIVESTAAANAAVHRFR